VLAFKQKTCRLGFHDKFAVETLKVKKKQKTNQNNYTKNTLVTYSKVA